MSRRRKHGKQGRTRGKAAIQPTPAGGLGGESNGRPSLTMINLERRAVANGWLEGLPPEKLKAVAEQNVKLATEAQDDRVKVNASKVVVAIVGQVMEQEKRDKGIPDQTHKHEHSGSIDVTFIARLVSILDRGGDISGLLAPGPRAIHGVGGDEAGPVAAPSLALPGSTSAPAVQPAVR